ncbi:MFS transporter [Bosea sp. BK604]|uniref:MFS transporter n=1 Tax=Bosea sp. BK604 TaxID=2512180 RepID=UPI00104508AA|nr:MFS transporter [Bosea sp. BK604]TCR69962.1 putative MFS family arabinose efflux permease [Bosea sp. BK604]
MTAPAPGQQQVIETDIPARLDRLPWSRFHTLVVIALGITWILDGLEVTLAGSVSGALKESPRLRFTNTEIGMAGAAYIAGAVVGALFFGWLTDRLGRKKLFTITVLVYLTATAATAFSWNAASFMIFRFFTGMGIGGEYTAINSTIQELVPARVRGWTDLVINGSFWIGAALGAIGAIILLDAGLIDPEIGWRLAFFIGAILGLVILILRLWIPESPRWLMSHGQPDKAAAIVAGIEAQSGVTYSPDENLQRIRLRPRTATPLGEVFNSLFVVHRQRALVGLALMVAQAFFYNAIFFTYALILTDFYQVPSGMIGWFILPFAAGNFLGPLLIGRLFDTLGRRPMIAATYALSGLLLAGTGWLFAKELVTATQLTLCWSVVFFFASAAASSAYLTVSETFPLEMRALAIAVFYAIGTGAGGIAGPWLFGILIDTGSRMSVFAGYLLGAALMLGAAIIAALYAVKAERRSLEAVTRPLNAVD